MPHPHLCRRLLFSQPYMLLKYERVGWSVRSQEKKDGGRLCHRRGSFIWSRASHGEHGDDHDDMNDGGDNRYVGPVMFYHAKGQGVVLFLEYNIMMAMLIRIEMMMKLV